MRINCTMFIYLIDIFCFSCVSLNEFGIVTEAIFFFFSQKCPSLDERVEILRLDLNQNPTCRAIARKSHPNANPALSSILIHNKNIMLR